MLNIRTGFGLEQIKNFRFRTLERQRFDVAKAIWLPRKWPLTKSEKTLLNGLKVDECCEKTNLGLRNFVGRLIQFIGHSMVFIGWFSVNTLNFTRFSTRVSDAALS
ncbi:MAG: hypothetical protein ACPHVG_02980, partial [Flavobacteriales bacterium]